MNAPSKTAQSDANSSLQNFMNNDEWEELLAYVAGQIEAFRQLEDENLRNRIFELLQGIDAIHREALTRLVRLFKDGVLEQVITDPPIHTLMEFYDLLPKEHEPGDIQVNTRSRIPARVLTGTSDEGGSTPPHWVPVLDHRDELEPGRTRVVTADDRPLLLCRTGDEWYALDPYCARDQSTLAGAAVNRYTLTCPQHPGCCYDIRSGARLGGNESIAGYPIRIDGDDRVLVGFGMPYDPPLPAF